MLFVFKLHIIGRNIKLIKFKIDNKFNGIYIYGNCFIFVSCRIIGFEYYVFVYWICLLEYPFIVLSDIVLVIFADWFF